MSVLAKDLLELHRLANGGSGALTEHLLRQIAMELIAAGVAWITAADSDKESPKCSISSSSLPCFRWL